MLKVLNYGGNSPRLFKMFFRPSHERQGTFDLVIIDRENLQNDMDDVIKYCNDTSTILIDTVTESGCINDFFVKYNEVMERYKNYNFILISDFDSKYRKEHPNSKVLIKKELSNLVYFGMPHTDSYWDCYELEEHRNRSNSVMSFNGSTRVSRILFLSHLLKNNLIDDIECSFLFYDHNDDTKLNEEVYINIVNGLYEQKHISLNEQKSLINYTQNLPKTYDNFKLSDRTVIQDSYSPVFNVITENTYGYFCCDDIKDSNTYTEKTLKPFMMEQIPIFIAQPKHVELLRTIGYDVFDDVIDHSYDNEYDEGTRMELIIKEIKKTLDKDGKSFYYNNRERFIRNRELCHQHSLDGYRYLKEFLIENKLF